MIRRIGRDSDTDAIYLLGLEKDQPGVPLETEIWASRCGQCGAYAWRFAGITRNAPCRPPAAAAFYGSDPDQPRYQICRACNQQVQITDWYVEAVDLTSQPAIPWNAPRS